MLLQGRLPKSITAYLYDKCKKNYTNAVYIERLQHGLRDAELIRTVIFQLISVMVIFKGIFEILRLPNLYCTNYDFFVFMMSLMMS